MQRYEYNTGFLEQKMCTLMNHSCINQEIMKFVLELKLALMTIKEAQQAVDQWITTTGVRYFDELTNMAILTEEVGEVARIMARKYGDQSFKDSDKEYDLADEFADVLWVLICLANQTGIDLTDAFQRNMTKKTNRDAGRHKNNKKLKQ